MPSPIHRPLKYIVGGLLTASLVFILFSSGILLVTLTGKAAMPTLALLFGTAMPVATPIQLPLATPRPLSSLPSQSVG
jgi:hypothetical protein